MSAPVDLRLLALRGNGAPPPHRRRRRHLFTRYALPAAVLLGFLGVIGWTARDSLVPSQPVTVVPVLTSRAAVQQEGTPLFQAAGWVECTRPRVSWTRPPPPWTNSRPARPAWGARSRPRRSAATPCAGGWS